MKCRLAFAGWVFVFFASLGNARADPCSAAFDALGGVRHSRRMVGEALALDASIEEGNALMRAFAPSTRVRVSFGFAGKIQSLFGYSVCTDPERSATLQLATFGPWAGIESPDGNFALRFAWMGRGEELELDTPKGSKYLSGPSHSQGAFVVSGQATKWVALMGGFVEAESVHAPAAPLPGWQSPSQAAPDSWFGVVRVPAIGVAATFVGNAAARGAALEYAGFDVNRLRIPHTDFYATLGAGMIKQEQQALGHAGLAYRRPVAEHLWLDVSTTMLAETNPPRVRELSARVELAWEWGHVAAPTADLIPSKPGFWIKLAPFAEVTAFGSRWLDQTGASTFVSGGAGGVVMRTGGHGFGVTGTVLAGVNRPSTLALLSGAIDHAELRTDIAITWAF